MVREIRAGADGDERCPHPHEETLCRWGRLWKDRGDRWLDAGQDTPAAACCYREALRFYEQAYALGQNYYPGINVATLSLLVGDAGRAGNMARTLRDALAQRPRDGSLDTLWRLATEAEANLLLGEHAQAAVLYQSALRHARCQPHMREAMLRQVERILRMPVGLALRLDEVFPWT